MQIRQGKDGTGDNGPIRASLPCRAETRGEGEPDCGRLSLEECRGSASSRLGKGPSLHKEEGQRSVRKLSEKQSGWDRKPLTASRHP